MTHISLLDHDDVAKLILAKQMSILEIVKSSELAHASNVSAHVKELLPSVSRVKEFRGGAK